MKMARVSFEKDRELAKIDLLRVSVVADLLGVAPKTINIWLKESESHKIRGVKYLNWSVVRKVRQDDVQILQLPVTSQAAHVMWEVRTYNPGAKLPPLGTIDAISHAYDAIEKAKSLLPKPTIVSKVEVVPEIEKFQTAEGFDVQETLEVPPPYEEKTLEVPVTFLAKQKLPNLKNTTAGMCTVCGHSMIEFHSIIGCTFAKHTVAACTCKVGV